MKTFTASVIEITIFALAFLLLIQLGLWQLKRAEQKTMILQSFEQNQALSEHLGITDIKPFSRVRVKGAAQLPMLY